MMMFFIKPPVGHTIGVGEQCSAKLSKLHNVDGSASDKEFIFAVAFLTMAFFLTRLCQNISNSIPFFMHKYKTRVTYVI